MRTASTLLCVFVAVGVAGCATATVGDGDSSTRSDVTGDRPSADGGDGAMPGDAADHTAPDVVHDSGPMCTGGQMLCGSACVDLQTDRTNCGACGRACPAAQTCSAGTCTCPMGQTLCGTSCVDTQTDMANCGMCGAACTFANATGTCTAGTCALGACTTGFSDCDGNAATGCEASTRTDPNNCGACGTVCSFANSTAACAAGICLVGSCNTGFADCDGVPTNGCEVNTQTDGNNCGACGTICTGGAVCVGGMCGCSAGSTMCGSLCVNTSTSSTNCGGCGNVCPAGQMCSSGACRITCSAPNTICGSGTSMTCVNLSGDNANCGACGNVCPAGRSCSGGTCVCPAGTTLCGATCTNTSTDNNNCGVCGRVCGAGTTCSAGNCVTVGPPNDTCAGATALSLLGGTTTVTGSTSSATHDSGCGGAADVWYSFTLTDREAVYVDAQGSAYDTEVGIYTSCGVLAAGGCNDDACGTLQSQVMVVLDAGTHYISIGGFSTSSGSYTLHIQHIPVPAGSNPTGVLPAGSSTQTGNTSGAPVMQLTCGYMGSTLWYYYLTCPGYAGGTFTASTCGASWDTTIELANGDGAGGVCNDDSCGLQSQITGTSSPGGGLHVFYMSGFSTAVGAYSTAITRP